MITTPLLNEESQNNDSNLETFSLVWLDDTIDFQNIPEKQRKLRTIINHLRTFHDQQECEQYIQKLSNEDRTVIIVNEKLGQHLIPSIHQLRQVSSIYVNCQDKNSNKEWISGFSKVRADSVQLEGLISQMNLDQEIQMKVEEPVTFNTFITDANMGTSTTGLNGHFVYFQLLTDCLLRMKTNETTKLELIDLLKKEYEGNEAQLNILHEFQYRYSADAAVWWYSRDSFFYRTLNKALRLQNIDVLFLFHSYMSDIYDHLQQHKYEQAIRVYRSQQMSIEELTNLKKYIGQFISFNSFLSTTMKRDLAVFYMGEDTPPDGLQNVLFEIDADPNVVTTRPFADISEFSDFDSEFEVLFMLGCIFRLNNISLDNDGHYNIEMILCSDEEHDLQEVFVHMKKQNGSGETNLLTLGNIVWKMGRFDLAEKYYYRLLNELPANDRLRIAVYKNLGDIASQRGDYEKSIEWRKKWMEMEEQTLLPDDIDHDGISHAFDVLNMEEGEVRQSTKRRAKQCIFVMACSLTTIISISMVAVVIYIIVRGNTTVGEKEWITGERYYGGLKNGKMHGYGRFYYASGANYTGEFLDNMRNGQGIYTWKDGQRYNGSWKVGARHGHGTLYLPNGDTYIGEFVNNTMNGYGDYTWKDGRRYIGNWKDGRRHGHGTFYYDTGDNYTGEFINGKPEGQGLYTYINGDRYNGSWKDNTMHGQGTAYFANGNKYVGNFVNGERSGKGIFLFVNGNRDEGHWANGKMHGSGMSVSVNGDKYVGDYVNGKPTGQGVFISSSGVGYKGSWKDGKKHGNGTLYSPDGNNYTGEFVNDKKHGQGIYIFENGGGYVGSFKDDKMHGNGTIYYFNGDIYAGDFVDGKRHGHGAYIYKNGSRDEGNWKDGKLHGHGMSVSPNGDKYIGEFAYDKRNGQGTYTSSNGYRYEGNWKDGKKHGNGTLYFPGGNNYTGEFINDNRHGLGTLTWTNGSKYNGTWKDDKMHGNGTLCHHREDKYMCQVIDDKLNEEEVYTSPNDDRSEGNFEGDKIYQHTEPLLANNEAQEGE